ncbi:hypothetical protein CYMTET_53087 [Cymbomonas tetramitiformis]|uniref:Uncharacterized protein n=1 Tax=Cymbomonas tetramitiformis TaxID=36881 RepID=A0AAE0BHP6_9CHLO|nr:hypothetical protein CYMTET_53087 [Cymbomonas tetramitiformis]
MRLPELAPEEQFLDLASEFSSGLVTTLPPNTEASTSHRARGPKQRNREPSSQARKESQRSRKPGRSPSASSPSSDESSVPTSASSSEAARSRESHELQELMKEALQTESRAWEVDAEVLMEMLSQHLQESQRRTRSARLRSNVLPKSARSRSS